MSAEAGTRQDALLCARAGTSVECDPSCADTCVVERAGTLDEAWAAAEAALPEGWIGPEVNAIPDTPGEWSATAFSRNHWEGDSEFEDEYRDERGPTPAAALLALAAALRAVPA